MSEEWSAKHRAISRAETAERRVAELQKELDGALALYLQTSNRHSESLSRISELERLLREADEAIRIAEELSDSKHTVLDAPGKDVPWVDLPAVVRALRKEGT